MVYLVHLQSATTSNKVEGGMMIRWPWVQVKGFYSRFICVVFSHHIFVDLFLVSCFSHGQLLCLHCVNHYTLSCLNQMLFFCVIVFER